MLYPSRKILPMMCLAFMSLPLLIASSPAPVSPFRRRVATCRDCNHAESVGFYGLIDCALAVATVATKCCLLKVSCNLKRYLNQAFMIAKKSFVWLSIATRLHPQPIASSDSLIRLK